MTKRKRKLAHPKNPDKEWIKTANGKIRVKEYFKILEEERNASKE